MKFNFKESKGITLIALVITVIVLLILAGVSIVTLTGENGILEKASTAKEKTIKAQYEEELNLCIAEMQTDELGSLNMKKIIEKLPIYIQKSQNTSDYEWDINQTAEEPEGIYKGYNFYIDKNKIVHIDEIATGITITCETDPTGYTKQNVNATIKIKSTNGLKSITPAGETTITLSGEKEYTINKTGITANTTYTYEIEDMQGKQTKTVEISNIDKLEPKTCTITAQATDTGIKITETAEDAEATTENAKSGIDYYEYYVTDSNSTTTKYITNTIELASGTYNVYAIVYDKAGNPKQSNTVENVKVTKAGKNKDAQTIASNPSDNYGKKVTNYISRNGHSDWKIFYSNGTNIFLITGNYLENSKIDATKIGMTKAGTYGVYWKDSPSMQNISEETIKLFKSTGFDVSKHTNMGSKRVSAFLNTENWTNFKDTENKAHSVIGSPTIEMWTESYNQLYPNDKVYCNNTNEYGYYVGKTSSDKLYNITTEIEESYKYKLYYPDYIMPNGYKVGALWSSSPSAFSTEGYVICPGQEGGIGYLYSRFYELIITSSSMPKCWCNSRYRRVNII